MSNAVESSKPNGSHGANGGSSGLAEKAYKRDKNGALVIGPGGQPVIDWTHVDAEIVHRGSMIVLPDDPAKMPIDDAIKRLQEKKKDEEQMMDVHEVIEAFPLDGAVAFTMALKLKYGWANSVPVPGFFGPEPPQMLTVEIGPGPNDQIQVPWGGFRVPGIENIVQTHVKRGEFGPEFVISSKLRKKESYLLKEIANLTRKIVKENSIYRGKAIRMRTTDAGQIDVNYPPKFIETAHIDPDGLILSEEVATAVETNIFTLIKRTAECTKLRIPLKRGVLLEGKYGTGKTLIAAVCAKHCVDNGWTYITIDKAQALEEALYVARRYEPCVIFAEDIDRITEDRDEEANDLLNILDGVLSKNAQILTVLTTNHVEKINQAMLRPGRLDAVISVLPPDADAVAKLLTMYGRGQFDKAITLKTISAELAGNTPAVIREVVERSKLAMVSRGGVSLIEVDLLRSAADMKNHMRLLETPVDAEPSPEELVGQAFGKLIRKATSLDGIEDTVKTATLYADSANDHAAAAHNNTDKLVEVAKRDSPRLAEAAEGVRALRIKAKV